MPESHVPGRTVGKRFPLLSASAASPRPVHQLSHPPLACKRLGDPASSLAQPLRRDTGVLAGDR